MMRISMKRLMMAAGMGLVMVAATVLNAGHAVGQGGGQGGDQGIVGTWTTSQADGNGGTLYTWFTFGQDGSYKMVTAYQGGSNDGNVMQRTGSYQAKPIGQGQYQTTIRITGGAPSKFCVQGGACTAVQGIQSTNSYPFGMRNGQLTQGNVVFQRGRVPDQLQQVAATKFVQVAPAQATAAPAMHPYTTPGTHPYTTPGGGANHDATGGIKGLNGNCDDAQQANICHYGNGGYYHKDHNTGCMICEKY